MRAASLFSWLDSVNAVSDALAQSCRSTSRATRRLTFEDASQTFTISSLSKKSVEDAQISLQVSLPQQTLPCCSATTTKGELNGSPVGRSCCSRSTGASESLTACTAAAARP